MFVEDFLPFENFMAKKKSTSKKSKTSKTLQVHHLLKVENGSSLWPKFKFNLCLHDEQGAVKYPKGFTTFIPQCKHFRGVSELE